MSRMWITLLCMGLTLGVAPLANATIVAPGYSVDEIPLSDFAAGDVVVVGDALFVGIGTPFVGQAQSVVRIDGSGTTVIAEGFNALAGFVYDAVNDRLIVGDNGAEAFGAVTGDTVYEISDPLGATGLPVVASSIELLPAGVLPGVADVVLDPSDPSGGTLIVSDSVSSTVSVVDLGLGTVSVLQNTPGFAGGLAVDATTLFYGDATFDANFVATGTVRSVALPGSGAVDVVATNLPGQFDLELAGDGSLLSTSGEEVVRIDPVSGNIATLATGFGFAAGLFEDDGTLWVLDGGFPGFTSVFVLTPIPEPTTAALVGLGLLGVLAAARRTA